MKKACFITTIPASLENFILATALDLHDRSGFDVTLISGPDEDLAASLPAHIHFLPIPMKRGISREGVLAPFRLFRIFRRERFDLVQYATPNASVYAAIAAWLARVPVRVYGQWGLRYVGLQGVARQVFKRLEKFVCSLSTDIRSVSAQNLEFALQEGLFPAGKSRVLGHGGTMGVDLAHYDVENRAVYRRAIRARHGIGDEFVFGYVGRFTRDKGANELLQALKNVAADTSAKLLCVGEVEAGVDAGLHRWARESGRAIFAGPVPKAEAKKYFSAFDCHVHPTYREGFGMVLQEAGAMGCAIITTDVPGASEVMEAGVSCLLARPRDAASLEEKMRLVMADAVLRDSLGRQARKKVEACYDRNVRLELLRMDYEELAKRGPVP